jgi:putative sigma-54 modulation protein
MNIHTKATNMALTPAISEYLDKKVRMLEKFFQGMDDVHINAEVGRTSRHHKSGDVFRAELHVIAAGEEYYADVESEDLYASIDMVKDEIAQTLTSKRKKALRMFRKGGARIKDMMKGLVESSQEQWRRFRSK